VNRLSRIPLRNHPPIIPSFDEEDGSPRIFNTERTEPTEKWAFAILRALCALGVEYLALRRFVWVRSHGIECRTAFTTEATKVTEEKKFSPP
jgi:hypothetical protein